MDPEKGLAMAIAKKALGNEGNYYNEFKKWLPEKNEEPIEFELSGYAEGRKIYSDKKFVIRMNTRKDAEKLIDDAIDIGKEYGYVTLSNLKELYGGPLYYCYREDLYGWTYKIFKREANIIKNNNGTYDITLPEPISLTNIKPGAAK